MIKTVIKEGSTWSSVRVIGTALTAITMALVASKITDFVSSLVLVGMLSIGTALFSEIYRILLSFTTLGAKKVVFKAERKNSLNGALSAEFRENTRSSSLSENVDNSSVVVEPVLSHNDTHSTLSYSNSWMKYLWSNSTIRLVVLFAVVATLTVTVSYFVSNSAEKVETTYSTIVNNPAQMLTDEEKQEIIDDASMKPQKSVLEMQSKIDELKAEKSALETKISKLEAADTEHKGQILSLQEQLDVLKAYVEEQNQIPGVEIPKPETVIPDTDTSSDTVVDVEDENVSVEEAGIDISENS